MNIFVVLTLYKFLKPLNIANIINPIIKIANSEDFLFFLNSIVCLKDYNKNHKKMLIKSRKALQILKNKKDPYY